MTKHALTKQHIKASSEIETKSGSIEKLLTVGSHSKEIEQRICIFLAEHNLPLRLADSLIPLLRKLFPKDQALAGVTLGKQKATNILRQNFLLVLQNQLVELLKTTFFSVIIDETTDCTIDKQLAIMVVFFSEKDLKLHVKVLDMVKCSDGSAEGLTNRIEQVIEENSIPWQNIVGFCADTTNVMFGANRSASTLMKAMVPHILNVKCSCHLIHLCSSYACLSLPKTLEDLARNIYAHFSRSASRREKFAEFQEFFRCEAHRILAPEQTRRLSLQACMKRLIEQRVALIQYFVETTFEDPTATNDLILSTLQSKLTKPHLEFMDYSLGLSNEFNTVFQSELPLLHYLKLSVSKLVNDVASNFMKLDYIRSVGSFTELDPYLSSEYLPLNQTYVGIAATDSMQELEDAQEPSDNIDLFYQSCRNYYIVLIKQIKDQFKFEDEIYDILALVEPRNAINLNPRSLRPLFVRFPVLTEKCSLQKTDVEWRS